MSNPRILTAVAAAAALVTGGGAPAAAQPAAPDPGTADPTGTLELVAPADFAVDLAGRASDPSLFVVEKGGTIVRHQLDEATGEPTTVLDIADLVSGGSEQGLLGLTFWPDGSRAYVNYTDTAGSTVVAEVPVSDDGAFDREAMRTLLTIEQPYQNHNGGGVAIGPDEMLYIGMGDGGSGGDPERLAQRLDSLHGKMLRIDPHSTGEDPYGIPFDNPFVEADVAALPEIWAIGLRNPWRFSFDATTGDLWIADVGQNAIEEINVVAAPAEGEPGGGANFGWSAFEGNEPFNDDVTVEDHHAPIFAYPQEAGRCSVSGGVRARGEAAGAFDGWYVFADWCTGEVFALEPNDDLTDARVIDVLTAPSRVSAVIAGPDGAIYVLDGAGANRLVS